MSFIMEHQWTAELRYKLHTNGVEYVDWMTLDFARTNYNGPDITIQTPFIYKGKFIHWIDTTSVEGTLCNHEVFTTFRLRKFVEEMGSGMFIYWPGFNECLNQESEINVVVADKDFATSNGDIVVLEKHPYETQR